MQEPAQSNHDKVSDQQRKVAIVAWQAKPAVFGEDASGIGGLETAAWTFAKGLAAMSDWRPTLVFRSASRLSTQSIDGVRLHAAIDRWQQMRRNVSAWLNRSNGSRLSQFSFSLLGKLLALAVTWPFRSRDPVSMATDPRLRALTPDVWIAMGVGKESAGVIATAIASGRPSILMIRSFDDLADSNAEDKITFSAYGERSDICRYAIDNASRIVCQTNVQSQKLNRVFGRQGILIRNAIDSQRWQVPLPDEPVFQKPVGNQQGFNKRGNHVLWIGRFDNFHKRIDLAIEVARRCPEVPFRFIANRGDTALESRIRSSLPSNVQILEYIPFDQMPLQFSSSLAFLSTSSSDYEGFPNVLLQAAASSTPIVSLQDFDEFIVRSDAGVVTDDNVDETVQAILRVVQGSNQYDDQAVQNYLKQFHSIETITQQLESLLNDLATGIAIDR